MTLDFFEVIADVGVESDDSSLCIICVRVLPADIASGHPRWTTSSILDYVINIPYAYDVLVFEVSQRRGLEGITKRFGLYITFFNVNSIPINRKWNARFPVRRDFQSH